MRETQRLSPPNRSAPAPGWCGWRVLPGGDTASARVLAEILDGGQAFRWQREAPDAWLGLWEDSIARVRHGARGRLEWSAPEALAERVARTLPAYLATDCDFAGLADALPWRSDPHLARCREEFRGLRILRQPFGETLLGFLCSATKQIVQIKQMLAWLAERHGTALAPGFHRLPTWTELAGLAEAELRQCRLGFRARFIADTARFLASHSGWLEETAQLPYGTAKARLCELPGVGEKIADCVLLFGAGRFEAFPVDTWILKALARHYGLAGWRPEQVAHFGRVHFGPGAGLAQQFLFAWERASRRRASPGQAGAERAAR
ncbi:MAG: DNA-binding protein [Verrucomicrobia bacterium]|nr:DNA-binding protein [Verrucomicrobiota bacterium]